MANTCLMYVFNIHPPAIELLYLELKPPIKSFRPCFLSWCLPFSSHNSLIPVCGFRWRESSIFPGVGLQLKIIFLFFFQINLVSWGKYLKLVVEFKILIENNYLTLLKTLNPARMVGWGSMGIQWNETLVVSDYKFHSAF